MIYQFIFALAFGAKNRAKPLGSSLNVRASGWGPEKAQQSGYLSVNQADGNDGHVFFWLFESRSDPSNDPLVIWLTGGPGCSSEVAIFYEQGPYRLQKDGSVQNNTHAWNSNANMLFVDNPVGVGFSYADDQDAYCHDEDCVGEDMYEFVTGFLKAMPQFKNNDFFVTGESYAGHYVPAVSWAIYEKIQQGVSDINLKGFAIGNGLTYPAPQYAQYGRYAYDNHLITSSQFNSVQQTLDNCVSRLNKGQNGFFVNQICQGAVSTILGETDNINVYDITKKCEKPPLCYDFDALTTLLQEQSVLDALGISQKSATWESCNMQVHSDFTKDWWSNLEVNIPTMLKGGLKVLVYSGTNDFIVNWYGGRAWVGNMTWDGQAEYNNQDWSDWKNSAGQSSGTFKTQDNLTFLGVYGAGHMVPMDQGQNSLEMLRNFMHGKPFATNTITNKRGHIE